MMIYDLIIYDDIDIYMREEELRYSSWSAAQNRLSKWFVSEDLSEQIYLELINMTTFKLQHGKVASDTQIERFKSFMSNYFLDNPNITQKSFDITIDFLKKTDNFRHNTDSILSSEYATEEILNYAIDEDFFGTDKASINSFFVNNKVSITTLQRYIESKVKSFDILIKTQILDSGLVSSILGKSANKDDTIILMAAYKQPIPPTLFLNTLSRYDPEEVWENPAIAIKQMILLDRKFIDDIDLWTQIESFIKNNYVNDYIDGNNNPRNITIILIAILTYSNINMTVINFIVRFPESLNQLVDNGNMDRYNTDTLLLVYNNSPSQITGLLPTEVKDVFIF